MVADWFAKIRQNETTLEVEHPDVVAVEEAATDAVANIDMSTKADATTVYTKAETEAKIAELSPPADWNTLANKPVDLVRFSYTADVHAINTANGATVGGGKKRLNNGGSCCQSYSVDDGRNSYYYGEFGHGGTVTLRVRYNGYRQESHQKCWIEDQNGTKYGIKDWGNGCCWQTKSVTGWYTFTLPAGVNKVYYKMSSRLGGLNIWYEAELQVVSWN